MGMERWILALPVEGIAIQRCMGCKRFGSSPQTRLKECLQDTVLERSCLLGNSVQEGRHPQTLVARRPEVGKDQ